MKSKKKKVGILPNNNLRHVKPTIVYRLFNPQVPVIICSKFGRDVAAMPANSCSSASDSPPLVSLALKKGIRTNRTVRSSSRFSINWLNFEPESSRRIILDLAKPSDSKNWQIDKLKEHDVPYQIVQEIPVLKDVCAFALCKVQKRIPTGDHDLFIASVSHARAILDFTADEYWRFVAYKPILYVGSIRANPLITLT
jgi:flavin reductase (DIM6/NTAB) family NADH-FMN oxidoreductase RutF